VHYWADSECYVQEIVHFPFSQAKSRAWRIPKS
jgi:hypothetical protein